MRYYYNIKEDLTAHENSLLKEGFLKQEKSKKVEYQGHHYQKVASFSKNISIFSRIALGLKSLFSTVFSCRRQGLSQTLQENWYAVYKGKFVKSLYINENLEKGERDKSLTVPNSENLDPINSIVDASPIVDELNEIESPHGPSLDSLPVDIKNGIIRELSNINDLSSLSSVSKEWNMSVTNQINKDPILQEKVNVYKQERLQIKKQVGIMLTEFLEIMIKHKNFSNFFEEHDFAIRPYIAIGIGKIKYLAQDPKTGCSEYKEKVSIQNCSNGKLVIEDYNITGIGDISHVLILHFNRHREKELVSLSPESINNNAKKKIKGEVKSQNLTPLQNQILLAQQFHLIFNFLAESSWKNSKDRSTNERAWLSNLKSYIVENFDYIKFHLQEKQLNEIDKKTNKLRKKRLAKITNIN